ncbi:putative Rho-type GTPase-activating protein 4 [Choanephora cucurbitarum]|uniref:Putative Rho-type GTPase-activating protein 4 n=1 Tax=Choanephora cucurbitarum TaxID=101091 RepID=A0A1C7N0V3_9FUNG|nr:putative Rho-type GTPase-activating protein 4 [Choanephora cucurbitarum]
MQTALNVYLKEALANYESQQRYHPLQVPDSQKSQLSGRLLESNVISDYVNKSSSSLSSSRTNRRPSNIDPPTPSCSRSNSVDVIPLPKENPRLVPSRSERLLSSSAKSSSLHSPPLSVDDSNLSTKLSLDLPALNLSFFDNESTELLNLTKKLGANISLGFDSFYQEKVTEVPEIVKTTEKITRASQLLESSLTDENEDFEEFPLPPTSIAVNQLSVNASRTSMISEKNRLTEEQLRAELENANAKLASVQANYQKIKDASRQALEEFTLAKEEFSKEVALRQTQEYTILQLIHQLDIAYRAKHFSRNELSVITRTEIERVAKARVELDRTCKELKGYRNVLVQDIESLSRQKQANIEISPTIHLQEQIKALRCEIDSLHHDRDDVREDTKKLEVLRDEVLHEMVMLNTKNAELTEINNDLSRRMTEREKEATAIMNGSLFLTTPSPSISTELSSPISGRKSSEASIGRGQTNQLYLAGTSANQNQQKMFKLKKKGNMFAKLSGKNGKDAIGNPYGSSSSLMSSSTGSLITPTQLSTSSSGYGDYFHSKPPSKSSSDLATEHGSHTFLATSFFRSVKCEACGEKMRGLSELRCQECHYVAHARCLPHVPHLCQGLHTTLSLELEEKESGEDGPKLFGLDLNQRAQMEERPFPLIIKHCIDIVEKYGMDYEGIYRKSGGAAQMRTMHQLYEGYTIGEEPESLEFNLENDEGINDICAVTSVLKQYFRELPDPLVPYNVYPKFIEAMSINSDKERLDEFSELLTQLPKVNYETLKLLAQHLNRVQERNQENLMTTKNLAMVFGPTLLRDVEASRDLIDMSYKNAIVEFLINYVDDLFCKNSS